MMMVTIGEESINRGVRERRVREGCRIEEIPSDAKAAAEHILRLHPELHNIIKPTRFVGCSPIYAIALRMAWDTATAHGIDYAERTRVLESDTDRRLRENEFAVAKERAITQLERDAGQASMRWTMAGFHLSTPDENVDAAYHLKQAHTVVGFWSRRVREGGWREAGPRLTMLIGSRQTGVGKTHLGFAAAREIVSTRPMSARFVKLSDYLTTVRDADRWATSGDGRSIHAAAALDEYRHCGLLVLDEVSLLSTPGFLIDRVVDLVDERIRRQQWTICTGQFGADDDLVMPRDGDPQALDAARRLRSRLAPGVKVIMHASIPDRRTQR